MSLKLSVKIPIGALPSPVDFINEISRLYLPDSEDTDVINLTLISNTILLICPMLQEYGETKWLDDKTYTFYLSLLSTRGLEVWHAAGHFYVRIMSLSAYQEWELAFQMLEFAVGGENALIETDWEPTSLRLHDIRDQFNEIKITEAIYAQTEGLFGAVAKHGTVATLEGPVNNFYIGPWLCTRILAAFENVEESMDEIVETIFSLMLLANFVGVLPHFDGYIAPAYSRKRMPDGSDHVAAAIVPRQGFFVDKIDELVVQDSLGNLIGLPADKFKDFLPKHFREPDQLAWIDEYQFALAPVSDLEFTRFVMAVANENFEDKPDRHSRGFMRKISGLFGS